jgi:ribosomal protein L40E
MKTRLCPKCGNQNPEDAWSCIKCGETLAIDTITEAEQATGFQDKDEITSVICPNCLSSNPASSKYCFNCGVNLNDPSNLEEISPTDSGKNIENTSQMQIAILRKFNDSLSEFQNSQYQLMNTISELSNNIRQSQRDRHSPVNVDNFNMPFLSIVFFRIKYVLASIPAMIILVIIFSIIIAVFSGVLVSIMGGFLKSFVPQVLQ